MHQRVHIVHIYYNTYVRTLHLNSHSPTLVQRSAAIAFIALDFQHTTKPVTTNYSLNANDRAPRKLV